MAEGYSTGSYGKSPGLLSKQLKKLVDDLVTAGATQDSNGTISGLPGSGSTPDGVTLDLNVSSQLEIKAGGVGTTQLASSAVTEGKLGLSDVTTNDVSSSAHGFAPKLPNDASKLFLGDGTYGYAAYYTENVQTANYTLVLGDHGLVVVMNVASANTLTVPPNSSVAFPVGSVISIYQLGAGQTTVTAGAGVTIQSPSSHVKLTGQYSSAALRKRATDTWALAGDISA